MLFYVLGREAAIRMLFYDLGESKPLERSFMFWASGGVYDAILCFGREVVHQNAILNCGGGVAMRMLFYLSCQRWIFECCCCARIYARRLVAQGLDASGELPCVFSRYLI